MELLTKVMKYLFRSNDVPRSQDSVNEIAAPAVDAPRGAEREAGAKVAAIAVALHHHNRHAHNDVRAKVAAIAAAIHHHELESTQGNHPFAGVAAVVAAIHHHKHLKK